MKSARVTIINPTGLHARPASAFVALAKQFSSRITIKNASQEISGAVNAKSIIHLLIYRLA